MSDIRRPWIVLCATACLLFTSDALRAEEAAAEEASRITIVVLDLDVSDVTPAQAELVNGVVAQTLSPFDNLEVVTTGDIRRVTDFEAQKQALGCDQDSCLAEIAGAMGAQYVIFGRMGRLDELVLVQLNLFDAEAARAVAREEVSAATLDGAFAQMEPAVRRLTRTLLPEGTIVEEVPAAPPPPEGASGLSLGLLWGGVAVATLAGVTAGATGAGAALNLDGVADKTRSPADRNSAKALGQILVITSAVSGAVMVLGLGVLGASFFVE